MPISIFLRRLLREVSLFFQQRGLFLTPYVSFHNNAENAIQNKIKYPPRSSLPFSAPLQVFHTTANYGDIVSLRMSVSTCTTFFRNNAEPPKLGLWILLHTMYAVRLPPTTQIILICKSCKEAFKNGNTLPPFYLNRLHFRTAQFMVQLEGDACKSNQP